MADNNFRTYRSLDPIAHGDADPLARDVASDPLAELARLIGQSDPAGESGRSARPAPAGSLSDTPPAAPELDWAADDRYAEPDGYEEDRSVQPRLADSYQSYPSSRARSPQGRDNGRELPPAAPYSGRPLSFDDGRDDGRDNLRASPARQRDERQPVISRGQVPTLAPQPYDDGYEADDQWHDDEEGQPHATEEQPYVTEEYEDYDDGAPSHARRNGFVLVVAVVGLALLGTAGAFSYRAMFGGMSLPSLPPIIKASDGPNKIIPAHGDSQGGTSSQADATNTGSGEKLVSREEQPVAIQAPNAAPRVVSTIPVLPGAGAGLAAGSSESYTGVPPAPTAAPVPSSAQAQASVPPPPLTSAPMAGTQPKKIHTVSIRPDQLASAGPTNIAPSAAGPAAAAPAATAPAPVARTKPTPPPAVRPSAASDAGSNAPLALVPSAQGDAAPSAPPRTRIARTEAPGAPLATTPGASASEGGGYAVQVTSQRSEAEAQTAYRSLRAKFPKELGGHEPIIRRADLGSKGTFYRALVGPFASMEAAAGMCSTLKAAGGTCLVQRN